MHELHSHVVARQALPPALRQTGDAIAGATIDLLGQLACEFLICVGAEGDDLAADVGFDVILETSEDDGSGNPAGWAAETDARRYLGAIADDGSDGQTDGIVLKLREGAGGKDYRFGYKGGKRFCRLRLVAIGTQDTGTVVGATAVLLPKLKPVAAQNGI
ncbi:MAG: hypothetical protein PsegKO_32920 [Pseudohongiellaceae bacterium]